MIRGRGTSLQYSLQMDRSATTFLDPTLPRRWIQPNYRSFNGLRGLAVLAVYLEHYGSFWGLHWPLWFAWSGVDLFFVLSGFLITGILFDTRDNPRFFSNFYVRRALRIFPLFYSLFLLILLLTPLLHLLYSPYLWTFALYIGNLLAPFWILSGVDISCISRSVHGATAPFSSVGHTWSLCVEEQFYLLWPAVIWWVRDRRRIMQLCIILCVLVIPFRTFLHAYVHYPSLIYLASYTRFDTLLVGSWMALWLRGQALSLRSLRRLAHLLFWFPAIMVVVMILRVGVSAQLVIESRFVTTIGFTLIALSYAGLVLFSLDDSNLVSRFLRLKPLSSLGVISYGFYLIHCLPLYVLAEFTHMYPRLYWFAPILGLAATIAIAALSYRYLETPFLRLKGVLAPQYSGGGSVHPSTSPSPSRAL